MSTEERSISPWVAVLFVAILFLLFMSLFLKGIGNVISAQYVQNLEFWRETFMSVCTQNEFQNIRNAPLLEGTYLALVKGDGVSFQAFNKECYNTLCLCMFTNSSQKNNLLGYSDIYNLASQEFDKRDDSNKVIKNSVIYMPNIATLEYGFFDYDDYEKNISDWTNFLMKETDFEYYNIIGCFSLIKLGCNTCENYEEALQNDLACLNEPAVLYDNTHDKRYVTLLIAGDTKKLFSNILMAKPIIKPDTNQDTGEVWTPNPTLANESTKTVLFEPILR